ncbi:MAG TPA: patatin-like phospholipase family protein [Angustibacter sp.]|nr:patatin-like phospholipase family protein [Angustibacter sp.]
MTELRDPPDLLAAPGDDTLPVVRDSRFREATATPRARTGTGLCLSGGGYRAALLHLGALRRLDELGVLAQVRTVSGVSGGSLAAAMLAHPALDWNRADGRVGGFDEHVAGGLRALTARNIRTPALLSRLLPWRWFDPDAGVEGLSRQLQRQPGFDRPLGAARPAGPRVAVSATDLVFGVDWVEQTAWRGAPARVGSYRAGYAAPAPGWTLGDACATSCAEPPFFAPRRVARELTDRLSGGHREIETVEQHRRLLRRLQLVDGGVYDNLGLEPVWKSHRDVLVSDGGGVFRATTQRTVVGQLARSLEILGRSGSNTRLRWLHAAFARDVLAGCTWGIDDVVGELDGVVDAVGYPFDVVELIARVRTDLDAFSTGEQQVLERHGYLVADRAVRQHAAALVHIDAPVRPPHEQVADPVVAAAALRGSARRTVLGRWRREQGSRVRA